MHPPKVALVLGAGLNVGLSVAKEFRKNGYKVALVARNPNEELSKAADLVVKADFSDPSSLSGVFAEVKAELGVPKFVAYNAYTPIFNPDPFSVPLKEWVKAVNINAISGYAAIQEAIKAFRELPNEMTKTFVFTGNCGIHVPVPILMVLGTGKAAAAHMIQCAVATEVYQKEEFRFYFADERYPNGAPMVKGVNGDSHAVEYLKLAEQKEQGAWEYTFVEGTGYVNFNGATGPPIDYNALGAAAAPVAVE
ncbi:hypothetical protein BGZ60DRAFT_518317 [Tricladium varicosporioides]|nr:hypothetical protein BGZ60DRAFT_518317 [Hymenoscyphus varicosporioides]